MTPETPADAGPNARTIALEAVSVDLGGKRALDEVTVRLTEHRIAVIGRNGSGKSTFARLLDGLVRPTAGRAIVHGIDPTRAPRRLRQRVGLVFSNPDAQVLMPTVEEDIRLSLRGSGLERAAIDERVRAALERFGLTPLAASPASSLSGGQKQLLALAAVLVREPSLLIADEPTTQLDLANARRIGGLLLDGVDQQLVVVTHDLELAARCDVALRFEEGRLVDLGDPGEVIAAYRASCG